MGKYVYQQLYEELRHQITAGVLPLGGRLPSEREWARRFGVSRETVRQAIDQLRRDGLVESRQGSGTYVVRATPLVRTTHNSAALLGVIMPDLRWSLYRQLMQGIARQARQHDLAVLALVHEERMDYFDDAIRIVIEQGVVAALIVLPRNLRRFDTTRLDQAHIPYVLLSRDDPAVVCDKVVIDNVGIGTTATRLLLDAGQCTPIFIGPLDYRTAWDRLRGYREALAAAGLPCLSDQVLDTSDGNEPMLQKATRLLEGLLAKGFAFDGVVAFNDEHAATTVQCLVRHGVAIPESVKVVGVDDLELAASCVVPLTTIRLDGVQAGERAVELVWGRLRNPNAKPVIEYVPATVVQRQSCPGVVTVSERILEGGPTGDLESELVTKRR
ncbi:MAG: GntR family transcriptional regulator [Limnochordales bacterium]|nr:GntR family transcriptional regulator [Limnochordales bacterium]